MLRLAVLSIGATLVLQSGLQAQGAFPAPLPGSGSAAQAPAPAAAVPPPMTAQQPPAAASTSFPAPMSSPAPMSGGFSSPAPAAGGFGAPSGFGAPQGGPPPEALECQKGFTALKTEAENKAKAIKAAGQRHAPPQEACKLIGAFSQAELKMIKFVETNTAKCHIPPQVADQMKKGHANTDQLLNKVCAAAANGGSAQGPAGPSLSEALGSASLPEAKATKRSGGSTFDTLNGNVLAR
ncbi:MAG: hypothetical protein HY242_15745 [Afipia sp.]|nr:hypothetical protein [Afipia sp.]